MDNPVIELLTRIISFIAALSAAAIGGLGLFALLTRNSRGFLGRMYLFAGQAVLLIGVLFLLSLAVLAYIHFLL